MWVVVYKWYIWPKHNNALVTNSSVKSRRGTIGIQLSTLEICSASFLFLPALYYGCFYSMLAVNSFNPELSSFNNSTLSWRIHPGQVWMAIFSSMMRFRTYKSCWYFAMLCRWVKWIHVYLRNQMFYFNFHLFELLPSPHDAVGDISALQLVAYTANAHIFFEGSRNCKLLLFTRVMKICREDRLENSRKSYSFLFLFHRLPSCYK
jgi:hypothetical protein